MLQNDSQVRQTTSNRDLEKPWLQNEYISINNYGAMFVIDRSQLVQYFEINENDIRQTGVNVKNQVICVTIGIISSIKF